MPSGKKVSDTLNPPSERQNKNTKKTLSAMHTKGSNYAKDVGCNVPYIST